MSRRLSWRPINFDRWQSLAFCLEQLGAKKSTNLNSAISNMRIAWERLGDDLDHLFIPAGLPGSHAAHHYHEPSDPEIRETALAAVGVDFETALVYLDIALQLSVECLNATGGLSPGNWEDLFRAAENGDPGLPTTARNTILYLQRTPQYVRNYNVVHPKALLPLIRIDNVGNASMVRHAIKASSDRQLKELNQLLHRVRPDIKDDALVGRDIHPHLALNWLGSVSYAVDDWEKLNELREAFGFLLPGAYEIGPFVDDMVEHFISIVPESAESRMVFAAGPTADRMRLVSPEDVAAPTYPSDRDAFVARMGEGEIASNSGNHELAAAIFRECITADPEEGLAYFCLGSELLALDQLDEGLEFIYKAKAIGMDAPEVLHKLILGHFNSGALHFRTREFGRSVPHYRRVHELSPADL